MTIEPASDDGPVCWPLSEGTQIAPHPPELSRLSEREAATPTSAALTAERNGSVMWWNLDVRSRPKPIGNTGMKLPIVIISEDDYVRAIERIAELESESGVKRRFNAI